MSYTALARQGQGLTVPIPVRYGLDGLTFTVFVDSNSRFQAPRRVGTAAPEDGKVVIRFTPEEIDAIKDSYFRVAVYRGNTPYGMLDGKIDYTPIQGSEANQLLIGPDGRLKSELLPSGVVQEDGIDYLITVLVESDESSVVNALDERYISKAGYTPGEGVDMAVIGLIVDDKIDAHVGAAEPHPEYDDLPSFQLLFENGLI